MCSELENQKYKDPSISLKFHKQQKYEKGKEISLTYLWTRCVWTMYINVYVCEKFSKWTKKIKINLKMNSKRMLFVCWAWDMCIYLCRSVQLFVSLLKCCTNYYYYKCTNRKYVSVHFPHNNNNCSNWAKLLYFQKTIVVRFSLLVGLGWIYLLFSVWGYSSVGIDLIFFLFYYIFIVCLFHSLVIFIHEVCVDLFWGIVVPYVCWCENLRR